MRRTTRSPEDPQLIEGVAGYLAESLSPPRQGRAAARDLDSGYDATQALRKDHRTGGTAWVWCQSGRRMGLRVGLAAVELPPAPTVQSPDHLHVERRSGRGSRR